MVMNEVETLAEIIVERLKTEGLLKTELLYQTTDWEDIIFDILNPMFSQEEETTIMGLREDLDESRLELKKLQRRYDTLVLEQRRVRRCVLAALEYLEPLAPDDPSVTDNGIGYLRTALNPHRD